MFGRAQGSLEYLLLVGAAIVLASTVIIMIFSTSSSFGSTAQGAAYELNVKKMLVNGGVLWARLNGDASDSSKNSLQGSVVGSVNWVNDSTRGLVLEVDGLHNSHISFGDVSGLDGDLTISYWAYPTNYAARRQNIVDKYYNGEFAITHEISGGLNFYQGAPSVGYSNCYASSVFTENNKWYHIAIVRKVNGPTSLIKIYKNGSKIRECTLNKGPSDSSFNLKIGDGYASSGFSGRIDEVLIFNRALSDSEIKLLS